jgi:hypothetical protein
MEKLFFLSACTLSLMMVSCVKDELPVVEGDPQVQSFINESLPCTPKSVAYEYAEEIPITNIEVECLPELIEVISFAIQDKGRWVQSATCHLNVKGREEVFMTGTGIDTGHAYRLYHSMDYHFNESLTDDPFAAGVYRTIDNVTLVNETTGQIYGGIDLVTKVAMNAHGEPKAITVDEIDCE